MLEDNKPQTDDQGADDIVVQTADGGEEESDNASDPTAEMLKDAPPRMPREFSQFMAISGQVGNPVLAKVNAEHIHKVLDYREAGNQRQDRQTHSARRTVLVAAMAGGLTTVVVFLVLVFQGESDLASEFLAGIIGMIGGGGLGYGLGRRR